MDVQLIPKLEPIHLFLTQKARTAFCKKHKIASEHVEVPDTAGACADRVKTDNGVIYFVSLSDDYAELPSIEIAAALVHEAVHIWQWYQEYTLHTTQNEIGIEQLAYGIEGISYELFRQYKTLHQKKK